MPLDTGSRIGPYEVLAPLGAGGMGEVYRARDTRLERDVALKSLPEAFSRDAERRARFEREAKLLASLSHANIGAIYGLEESNGMPYLVLEFLEGETLARRLERGALSVRETLALAVQIATGIEAAHERGIVHRDLKPANVMLTPAGVAKVLDFGLAKGDVVASGVSIDLSASPTAALSATGMGTILGTAPYMSPEQARGVGVDRRTDVWAFGCILFECLSGRQTFAGATVSDVIARILERDPEWAALPASVPPRLRELIRRCLTKSADDRPRDIGDLRRELTAIAQELSGGSTTGSFAAAATPSLAVLYFENLASDKESEYFCAGITEDILTDLSKIKGLRVASRNAVSRYRGATVEIPKVAVELGVGAVLEGSVRRAGDRVRITAQLINAADGFHLWAERYDRTLEDVFSVQEEIASSIAAALRVALTPAEAGGLVRDRPNDVRAYDLYLKGRAEYGRYSEESLAKALALFREATGIDPNYALAWAGIADALGQTLQWGYAKDRGETIRLALEAAERAVAINSRLAEGHKARALVLRSAGDREGCRAALALAVEVNPRFAPALLNLAVERFCSGDAAAAERLIRRVIEIDPQEPFAMTWLAFLLMLTSRPDASCDAAVRLRAISSEPFYLGASYGLVSMNQLRAGDLDGAERTQDEAVANGLPRERMRTGRLAVAIGRGHTEAARRELAEIDSGPAFGVGELMLAAAAAIRLGDLAVAVRSITRPIVGDLGPMVVRLDPELHALLDREPFAPRQSELTLVWPLEAPMIDAARHAVFREVRIESGIPPSGSAIPVKLTA